MLHEVDAALPLRNAAILVDAERRKRKRRENDAAVTHTALRGERFFKYDRFTRHAEKGKVAKKGGHVCPIKSQGALRKIGPLTVLGRHGFLTIRLEIHFSLFAFYMFTIYTFTV